MLSDSRIVAHFLSQAIATFADANKRRQLAHELRRIRNTTGRAAARLVLVQTSGAYLSQQADRAARCNHAD